jgi:hypothetical protein
LSCCSREKIMANKRRSMCKYSHHSYLNLSLISGLPRKGIFSLLNEYRRETEKGEQKGRRSISALRARCQDARVYSYFLDDNRREKMIGCHLWGVGCGLWVVGRGLWGVGLWAPDIAFLRFFTPNPFSRNGNWTFINVHFWKS